jgi:phosphate acetyltransferase
MSFIGSVFEKLLRHPKRIVFPEGNDPRVLSAASRFAALRLGAPILLGNSKEIESAAAKEGINLARIGIVDPATASDLPQFCERLEKLRHYHDLGKTATRELMTNPHYFAAMMVQYSQADALVAGVSSYASSVLRPVIQLIKPLPGTDKISSCTVFVLKDERFGDEGVLLFADCAVIPEPTVEQLAMIAIQTGKICRQVLGIKPRVAMLSFSTKGSSKQRAAEKMAAATALARSQAEKEKLEIEIDGEMQADAALLSNLAERKTPTSTVAGRANVLIFPDLNAGNIAAKLVQYLAGAETYGEILLGPSKPCAHVSRGSSVEEILGVAAIVGLQAIEFRKLYPAQTE